MAVHKSIIEWLPHKIQGRGRIPALLSPFHCICSTLLCTPPNPSLLSQGREHSLSGLDQNSASMAAALGLECASLCWASMYSAHLGHPCSSSGPIQSTGLHRRIVLRTRAGGLLTLAPFGVKKWRNQESYKSSWTLSVASNEGGIVEAEEFGEPISLGTMKLPSNIDLKRLENLLFQWANSLTQSANVPLPVPIKVDKVKGGIRLGFIRVNDGKVEDLAHIDCLVSPATEGSSAIFRALRNGKLKNETPPGEPAIMGSLLQALKKSIDLATI